MRRDGRAVPPVAWGGDGAVSPPMCVTGVSLSAIGCLSDGTPRGQPWTSAVTLPQGAQRAARIADGEVVDVSRTRSMSPRAGWITAQRGSRCGPYDTCNYLPPKKLCREIQQVYTLHRIRGWLPPRLWPQWALVLACLLHACLALCPQASSEPTGAKLAILLGALWPGEPAVPQDLSAMYEALRQRAFQPEDVLRVEGVLTRPIFLAALHTAQARIASWSTGDVLLYVSGHGTYRGTTAATAAPGVLLRDALPLTAEDVVWWEDIWHALGVPPGVRLTVVPDT
jgi:hypothetical protein